MIGTNYNYLLHWQTGKHVEMFLRKLSFRILFLSVRLAYTVDSVYNEPNYTLKYRSLYPKFAASEVATTFADLFGWKNLP
jgi:hypothetical protein